MLRFLVLLTALCVTKLTSAADPKVAAPKVAEPKVAERWAVLIGVDDYANANDLQFCGADQGALRDRLVAAGFRAENVVLMHDRAADNKFKPSQRNIEQQLSLVISNAEADDLLVVAFSGHGVSLGGKSFLCPSDARLGDPATLVSLDTVYEQLRNCAARFKWVLVDACRNDPTLGGQRSLSATEGTKQLARSLQEIKLPEGVVLLNSCAPGEISWEEEKFGHGVYMHYVLEGMDGAADSDGDKGVSLFELQRYASGRTRSYVTGKFNSTQRPFYRSEGEAAVLEYALLPVAKGSAVTPLKPAKPERPAVEVPASLLNGGDPIVEAWATARTVVDPEERSRLLGSVSAYQAKLPDLDTAKEAMAEAMAATRSIAEADARTRRLQQIAAEQAKLPDLAGAKSTLAESASAARSITGTSREYNLRVIAKALHQLGDSSQAKQIFAEVLIPARRDGGLYVAWVAKSQAEVGDSGSAAKTFEEAKSLARKSQIAGWEMCDIAEEQMSVGLEAAARTTYEEARRLGKLGDGWHGFFLELAELQMRQGQLKAATGTIRSIGDISSSDAQSAFCLIAEAEANQGDVDAATAIANQLTDDVYRGRALGAVAEAKFRRADVSGALSTIASIKNEDMRQRFLFQIGEAQRKQGDVQGALLTARSLSMSEYRIGLLADLGAAQAGRDAAEAESLFQEALTGILSLKADEGVSATSSIVAALAKAGQLKRALEVTYALPTPAGKAKALIAIANALHEKKHPPAKESTP